MLSRLRDGVIVYLAGGLGNQLFQCAAGLDLAKKIGGQLYIDLSFYRGISGRKPEIFETGLQAEVLGANSPWSTARLPNGRAVPFPSSLRALGYPPLLETKNGSTREKLRRAKSSRTLFGYFQSFDFFRDSISDVESWFSSRTVMPSLEKAQGRLEGREFTAVHVRLGDFLGLSPKFSLEQRLNDLSESLRVALDLGASQKVVVFTDSRDLVSVEFFREHLKPSAELSVFDDRGLSSVSVLLGMSQAQHFVLSASTFGFWSAWLSQQLFNPEISKSVVLAPKQVQHLWVGSGSKIQPEFRTPGVTV